jgi:hypothetical protein
MTGESGTFYWLGIQVVFPVSLDHHRLLACKMVNPIISLPS